MSTEPRPAATVVLLREGAAGLEVLLVERSSRSAFMPSVNVFPGGRVEEADHALPLRGGHADRARMDHAAAKAYQAAAIRETFEESGVFLGEGEVDEADRAEVQAGRLAFSDLLQRTGFVLDADRLRYWGWWITPEVEPRRFDTRFFVASVPPGASASHDQRETVDSRWWPLHEALAAFARGELVMAPPTWATLMELVAFTSAEEALSAATLRNPPPLQPIARLDDEGAILIVLPGDPEHPSDWRPPGATRLRLMDGRWQLLGP